MVERIRPFAVSIVLGTAAAALGLAGMALPKTGEPYAGASTESFPGMPDEPALVVTTEATGTAGPQGSAEAVLLPDMATLVPGPAVSVHAIPPAPAVLPRRKPASPVQAAASGQAGGKPPSQLMGSAAGLLDDGAAALSEAGDKVGQAAGTVYGHGKAAGSALVGAISRHLPDW